MPPLPFIPGQIYHRRTEIHDRYKGNGQSGISTSSVFPYIFIFSGSQGLLHGYKDQWDNKYIFSYTGEGQVGDMQFSRGNLALRDHLREGKRVFLFEYVQRGYVRFVSEMEFFDFGFFETHDRDGDLRIGIKFFFKRAGVELPISREMMDLALVSDSIPLIEALQPNETERSGLVTTRVGQGAYRKSLLHRWEYQCAVTQFNDPRILIASHIVPWKQASDAQRLDVDNGILLSPTYDALFDRHLITFENSGKIILSDQIQPTAYARIGITGKEQIRHELTHGNKAFLQMHQQQFALEKFT
jgi:5-methylcytosine-specific restriction enzyme A